MSDDIMNRLMAFVEADGVLWDAVHEIKRLRADRDRWRKIADDLYKQLAVSFCWHCGHEATRCIDADKAADNYRQAVCGD